MSQSKPPYTVAVYRNEGTNVAVFYRRLSDGTRTFEGDAEKAVEAGYTLDKVVMGEENRMFLAIWKLKES